MYLFPHLTDFNSNTQASGSSRNAFVSGAGGLRFKSNTVLPTACHRCYVSSKEALLPGRNDSEKGPRKLVTRFGVVQRV